MQTLWNSLKSYCGFREAEPEVDLRQNTKWINHSNGHWEFTGNHLWGDENLPDYNITRLNVPNATTVNTYQLRKLKHVVAPKAKDISIYNRGVIVHAPKATYVNCHKPANFEYMLEKIENPQNLLSFNLDNRNVHGDFNITQDIKKADMDLNGSEYVKQQNNEAQFNTLIGAVGDAGKTLQGTIFDLGTLEHRESFDEKASLFGSVMNFYGLKHEDLDNGIHYQTNQPIADENIKDYKKQNIVQKTREIAQAR